MRKLVSMSLALALVVGAGSAMAQPVDVGGVVRLSASARSEVANDQLSATLYVEQENADAKVLMARVNQVLSDAQTAASRYKDVEVRTSAFNTYPIYDNGARSIRGWRARAELTLTGPLKGSIAQTVAVLQETMLVAQLTPGVSNRRREEVREELAIGAIRAFRDRATAYAQAFGATSWELHEAAVDSNLGQPPQPYPMTMKASMRGVAESASVVPVEAGNSILEVTVTGSIRALVQGDGARTGR